MFNVSIGVRWAAAGLLAGVCAAAPAQFSDTGKTRTPVYQAGLQGGFIFAHSTEVQNTSGARPRAAEVAVGSWRNDSLLWNTCRCAALQSLTVAFHYFDSDILGSAVSAAYSLEPVFRITPRSSFSIRALAGLAYLTNPFHPHTNPANQSYSMPVSAYIALGPGYWWKISDYWQAGAHLMYQHVSNGGMRHPNRGINWPTANLVVNYSLKPRRFESFTRGGAELSDQLRWDITVFGVGKRIGGQPDGRSLRFLVAGAHIQTARQVGRISNLTGGIEVMWDDAVGNQLRTDQMTGNPWRVSVTAGHEFILGRFLFSQQLGVYLHQPGRYFDPVYHRWGLAYRLSNHWMTGVSMKAHRHVADFTDFRLTYSF
jgi:hypothetical protein